MFSFGLDEQQACVGAEWLTAAGSQFAQGSPLVDGLAGPGGALLLDAAAAAPKPADDFVLDHRDAVLTCTSASLGALADFARAHEAGGSMLGSLGPSPMAEDAGPARSMLAEQQGPAVPQPRALGSGGSGQGEADSSPGSVVCSPQTSKHESALRCPHCMRKLKDMADSPSIQCQTGARRWEKNWAATNLACFGACQCSEFCAAHGYPMSVCVARTGETRHCVLSYRGTWVMHRAKRDASEITPSPAAEGAAGAGPGASGSPFACECTARLEKLRGYEWVSSDTLALRVLGDAEALSREGHCQGYCKTQYCCKIHWCPACIQPEGEGKTTKYKCPYPHESKGKKGRHHLDFAFFCPDPACCNGKWYSRDETHNRRRGPRVHMHTELVEKMLVEGGVRGAREGCSVATADRSYSVNYVGVGAKAPQPESGDESSDYDSDDAAVMERQRLVVPSSPTVEAARPPMAGAAQYHATKQQQQQQQAQGARQPQDITGSVISINDSLMQRECGEMRGSRAPGSVSLQLKGRVILSKPVFIGLVALCFALAIAAAVPSALLARSVMSHHSQGAQQTTHMCWNSPLVAGAEGAQGQLVRKCAFCTWDEVAGSYECPDGALALSGPAAAAADVGRLQGGVQGPGDALGGSKRAMSA
eukprot:m51a1_g2339 hypothetical protein (647) ;mRNA; f:549817-552239